MLDFYLIPTIMIVYIGIRFSEITIRNTEQPQHFENFKGKFLDFYGILTNNDFM